VSILLLSFLPYLLPVGQRPSAYLSPTPQEMEAKRTRRRLDAVLGGDASRTGLFPPPVVEEERTEW
jgi:hypothetical protein